MNHQVLYIFLLIAGATGSLQCRQATPVPANRPVWQIAATLPCHPAGWQHPGLAGAISGFCGPTYLIAGGANFPEGMPWAGGVKKYYDTIYAGGIEGNRQLSALRYVGRLPRAVAYAAQAHQADTLWVLGGETSQGPTAACYGISLQNDTIRYTQLPPLPVATAHAASCLLHHTLYLAGGETAAGTTPQAWALHLDAPVKQWEAVPPLPVAVSHAVLLPLPQDGGAPVLHLIGGRCKRPGQTSVFYNQVWQLVPDSPAWTGGTALPYAISAHSGAVLGHQEMYIFGGDKGDTFKKVEEIMIQLAHTKDSVEQKALMAQKAALQAGHPGFSRQVWRWHSLSQSWQPAGELPFLAPVTTQAVVRDRRVWIGSGEIKAGIRTPHILQGTFPDTNAANVPAP